MNTDNRHQGRNSPCGCGSGRKYKHCCLAVDEALDAARQQPCLLCGEPLTSAVVFSRADGAGERAVYSLCRTCLLRPDRRQEAEARILQDNRP